MRIRTYCIINLLLFWMLKSNILYGEQASKLILNNQSLQEIVFKIADAMPKDRFYVENFLNNYLRKYPDSAEAHALLARYYLWEIANGFRDPSDLWQASQFALQTKDLSPDRPLGDYVISEVFYALGHTQDAEKIYYLVHAKYPDHPDTYVFDARYLSDKLPSSALEAAEKALAKGVNVNEISGAIYSALNKLSKPDESGLLIELYANKYTDRWLWHRAGLAYLQEKKYSKAQHAFANAIKLGNTLESRLQLAIINYSILNNYQDAIKEFKLLLNDLAKEPNNLDKNMLAGIYAHLSIAYLNSNLDSNSLVSAHKALSINPENQEILSSICSEFIKVKKMHLLKNELESFVRANPFAENAHLALANIAIESKNYKNASIYFSKLIALDPEKAEYYAARGQILYSASMYEDSLHDFEKAIIKEPDQGSHYYNRSCLLALIGRKKEALETLKEAISLNEEFIELAAKDKDLVSLVEDKALTSELAKLGILKHKLTSPVLNIHAMVDP